MPLILDASDERLGEICRQIEVRAEAAGVPASADLKIDVEVATDFNDPQASGYNPNLPPSVLKILRETPAGYRASTGKVHVNASTFFSYSTSGQASILAHELGHAIGHKTGEWDYKSDLEADLLACRLGYYEDIRADRGAKYPRYLEGLAKWADLDEARASAAAGLVQDKMKILIG